MRTVQRRLVAALIMTLPTLSSAQNHSDHFQHQQHQHEAPKVERSEPTESERAHVPPPPPEHPLGPMSNERMIELMQMEDDASLGMLRADQLEWRSSDADDVGAWELQAWYGNDYDKIWLETEGAYVLDEVEGRIELRWDRIIARWWSMQAGLRHDFDEGSDREWLAVGLRGTAPYFFGIDASLYVADESRSAARLSAEHDLLLTQRLILQSEIEVDLYGKRDLEAGIGAGFSDLEIGVRLRYELLREFAPYVGLHWERKLGDTADLARASGADVSDAMVVVGLRAWF